jgi:ketosteroid isomerase-like protein
MYKATVRRLIRRSILLLNEGHYEASLAVFASDATLSFPGDNSWSNEFRSPRLGREPFATHRGKEEIATFLRRYVGTGMQMSVEDILVNGPPWNTRVAVRVNHGIVVDGVAIYTNRAVLMARIVWAKIRAQEDYEDTERVAAFDREHPERAGRRTQ